MTLVRGQIGDNFVRSLTETICRSKMKLLSRRRIQCRGAPNA